MDYPIYKTLSIINNFTNVQRAWLEIVYECRQVITDAPWETLPLPSLKNDIDSATMWLKASLTRTGSAGVYLGLDTLNMRKGNGTNVALAINPECEIESNSVEWIYSNKLKYQTEHLIQGLYTLNRVYKTKRWSEAFELCDYIFFLGYSGLVLTRAFERLRTKHAYLSVWGFHDGDEFILGRKHSNNFTRICA